MKTKAMVLVIAKMNMKVLFNFLYENFVKMLVFIKVNESSLVSQM